MKRLLVILCCALLISPAFAQVVTGNAPVAPVANGKKALKAFNDTVVYYQQRGTFILNLNNFIINQVGIVTMPVNLGFEATVAPGLTIGPMVSYLEMKNVKELNDHMARIDDHDMNYHLVTPAVRASYHFMPLIQRLSKKKLLTNYVDAYVTGWGGYSIAMASGENVNPSFVKANTTFRGGAAAGVRSMVLPRFGFFIEGGYSSFGYLSFGITARVK